MKVYAFTIIPLFIFLVVTMVNIKPTLSQRKEKTLKKTNPLTSQSKPRLISFDAQKGDIEINWDISIPFITIPLKRGNTENGHPLPFLNVNTKTITIAGLVTAFSSILLPLLSQSTSPHEFHYRSDDNSKWKGMSNSINQILFSNNNIASCMQRTICSIVSVASHSTNPTSTQKIIDGLSSHSWFQDVTNGTIIHEAIAMGREGNQDCVNVYKSCFITPKLLTNLMNQFKII